MEQNLMYAASRKKRGRYQVGSKRQVREARRDCESGSLDGDGATRKWQTLLYALGFPNGGLGRDALLTCQLLYMLGFSNAGPGLDALFSFEGSRVCWTPTYIEEHSLRTRYVAIVKAFC